MVEGRSRLSFALKAAQSLSIGRKLVGQKFQGDGALKSGILGSEDHAHTAPAELFDHAVVRNCLPDHWPEILGLKMAQVN